MKALLFVFLTVIAPLRAATSSGDVSEGLKLLQAGRYADARKAFRQIQGPECPLCGLYLGIAHYRSGNFTEARKALDAELAKGAQAPAPALALGYSYLMQSQRLEPEWMAKCLALSSTATVSRPEERLFMAQSLLEAVSRGAYPDTLRDQGADQVIAEALVQADALGSQNMAGRAWILKAEVAKRRGDLPAELEAMQGAVAALEREVAREPRAVYLQNNAIATRLLAEIKDRRLWTMEKLGPSNAEAVALAKEAHVGYQASMTLMTKAQAAEGSKALQPRLAKVAELSRHQLQVFESNASVKKILGLP